ncbi:MAG: hypothetical protein PWQ37_2342 [Candidatus Petromonas sp.]|jgi:three-Cys-motif partner protein|nr:hypothetical protein [Candidatus Petromonas sp.]
MSTNNFFEKKRGWSIIKDEIISHYLTPYIYKLLTTKKPLTLIDCFAGKGVFEDGSIGSPIIIANKIKEILEKNKKTDIKGIFIEKKYYDDLKENLKTYNNCEIRKGTFEDHIIDVINRRRGSNIFLYIDPYGIKSLDFVRLKKICKSNFNTLEMLMNFNSFGFLREASRLKKYQNEFYLEKDLESYEVDEKNSIENMIRIAGGEYWIELLDDYNRNIISMHEAERKFVEKYVENFHKLFKHVINIPIKTKEKNIPKYRLIFGTNHDDGLTLMADNMNQKWKKIIENERQGQLSIFDVAQGSIFSEAISIYSFPDFTEEKDYNPREDIINILYESQKYVKFKTLIVKMIKKYGIAYSTKEYISIIKQLKKEGIIDIYRNPPYTKSGRPARWYDINRDIRVRLRCFIKQ